MNIEILNDNLNFSNTYIVSTDKGSIIFDPSCDIRTIQRYIKENNVLGVFLTHGHFDHFKELEKVLKTYNVKCYLHKNAKDKIFDLDLSYARMFNSFKTPEIKEDVFVFVKDGNKIKLEDIEIKVLFTPGHTNCSVVYIINDMMISGDTLFKLSVGRTDLATGNKLNQMQTLDMLKRIKTDYTVFPGHDEVTSLFYEQKYNPYMK